MPLTCVIYMVRCGNNDFSKFQVFGYKKLIFLNVTKISTWFSGILQFSKNKGLCLYIERNIYKCKKTIIYIYCVEAMEQVLYLFRRCLKKRNVRACYFYFACIGKKMSTIQTRDQSYSFPYLNLWYQCLRPLSHHGWMFQKLLIYNKTQRAGKLSN